MGHRSLDGPVWVRIVSYWGGGLPFDEAHSQAQIEGLLAMLAPPPKRVVDLGCGNGRVLIPLARAGHKMAGIDCDQRAIDACRESLKDAELTADLICGDFRALDQVVPNKPVGLDAVLCLGNTFMSVVQIDEAINLARQIADLLRPGGSFIIDDFPYEYWAEIATGNWQTGISDDGGQQIVFEPGDAVFALRSRDAINTDSLTPEVGETRYRLWSIGALALLARHVGLPAPVHDPAHHLIVFANL